MSDTQKTNWFQTMLDKINMFAEQFELDEVETSAFRDFILTTAREQFKVGSKSGAGWAFKQVREGKMSPKQMQQPV
ncbi:hypothetical protein HZA87_06005 [Candidatus Uhrbacteria bacterium]|nr:hypothetical protein [Candidatus Uhrbacteria bacterium]